MLSGCPNCGGNKFQFHPSSATSAARKAAADTDAAANTGADADGAPNATTDAGTTPTSELSADSARANVEQEASEPARNPGADQFDTSKDAEIDNSTAAEDNAQRDARSSPATTEEIDEARRKMAAAERERLDEAGEERAAGRQRRGRGTPQGPPTEEPDEAAAQEFGLDGPVGGPDKQPSTNAATQSDSEADPIDGSSTDLSALREELNDQFESIKITAPGQYELNLMELYERKEYIISLQEDGRYVVDISEGHEHRED